MRNPSGFANRCLLKLGSYLSQSLGDRHPIFRFWPKQIVNSFGNLEIFSGRHFKGAKVILLM